MFLSQLVILFLGYFQFVCSTSSAFVNRANNSKFSFNTVSNKLEMTDSNKKGTTPVNPPQQPPCPHPFSELPGDPSLILVTNLDLGDKKLEIMKQCSKAISTATGKPESYIGTFIWLP
jgi:hypothetical protein